MPIQFTGGPLDGQGTMLDEEMGGMEGIPGPVGGLAGRPAAPPGPPGGGPMDAMAAAPVEGAEPPAGEEGAMFRSLLESIRGLLSINTLSEKNKLALEKASTLVQQIKADEEKDEMDAMTGKLNPTVMRKLGNGGSSGSGY